MAALKRAKTAARRKDDNEVSPRSALCGVERKALVARWKATLAERVDAVTHARIIGSASVRAPKVTLAT
ncbi:MAG: hypothetical protein JNK72_04435 [Myxococcales bacterium]|nr:hypothetical protein [Myxococcales bacterium]